MVNIFMVNNKSETVGSFWYIMVEMFEAKIVFFKKLYLLMQTLICCLISMLLFQTTGFIDLLDQNGA